MGVVVGAILVLAELAVRVGLVIVILLRRHGDATSRLAWLMVVILFPVVGAIAYLFLGEIRLGRRRIERHREIVLRRSREQRVPPRAVRNLSPEIPLPFAQIASLAEAVGGTQPVPGNDLELYGLTEDTIDAIIADIDGAKKHCHLLTYIYLSDQTGLRVGESLVRAEERGVQCRVLVDAVGSRRFLESKLCQWMREKGVQIVAALPVNPLRALFSRVDLRNHRKIIVIDGCVGYTGSQNIADAAFAPRKRFAPWVDAMVRAEGPVAHDLQMLFVEDWYLDTDEWLDDAIPSSDIPVFEGGSTAQVVGTGPNTYNQALRQVILAAIHLAREELILTTPYFVPDDSIISALMTAARRGVETVLVLPARNDSRLAAAASQSYFEPLLEAGVEIWAYRSGLLHAKTLTIDRDFAIIGSANLDRRSFLLNFESGMIVYDPDFASRVRFLQRSYITASRQIEPLRWSRRPWPQRLWHNAAGLLSPLL